MSKSLIIDPRTEDARNAPLEIWRDVGRGPGVYLTSEAYPDPEISGESASGEEGTRYEGRRKVGNRRIPLGVHVMEGDEPAGENLVPFTADSASTANLTATGATLATTDLDAYCGERAFLLTKTTSAGSMSFVPSGPRRSVARALRRYVAQARFKRLDPAVSARSVRVYVSFLDSGGTIIGTATPGSLVTESDDYVRAEVSAVAPNGTAYVILTPEITGCSVGEAHLIDALQIEERLPSLRDVMLGLGSSLLFAANPSGGTLTDLSANAYAASLLNGATVDATELVAGSPGAVSLDGSNDYASLAAPTRRNLCTNPRVSGNLTGWASVNSPTEFTRVTGVVGPFGGNTAIQLGMDSNGDACHYAFTATAGVTYTFSLWVKMTAATGSPSVRLWAYNNAWVSQAASSAITVVGDWVRLSATWTAAATETHRMTLGSGQSGAATATVQASAGLLEQASSVGTYFDGEGYVSDVGVWVTTDGQCGWLGPAHASASDKGPLANGTTRTFVGVARVSADAASGVGQTLFGSNLVASSGGTLLRLYNNAGTRQVQLYIGTLGTTWTLTAAEIAATAAGQTFTWRLEFNEPADTATLQINDLPAVTKTGVTAQHGAGQTQVHLGAYGGGSSPLPGKMGPTFGASVSLTTDAWETIRAAVARAADASDPYSYFDGDIPGCRWSGMAMASTSLRPAPGGQRMERIVADLEEKLEKLRHEGGSLSRWFSVGRGTFDVETVSGSPGDINPRRFRQGGHGVEFELEALPYMRGAPSVAGSLVAETTLPVVSTVVDAPEGTALALGSMEIGNDSGYDRFGLVAGVEVADYTDGAANVENYLEAEALTPINGASTQSVSGAHGGSTQTVRIYGAPGTWQGGLTTQKGGGAGADLAHVGTYVVWARIFLREASKRSWLRLVYGLGDLKRRQALDPILTPLPPIRSGTELTPVLVKLGTVTVERPPAGQTARWRGEVQIKSAEKRARSHVDVDELRCVPAGEGYAEIMSPTILGGPDAVGMYATDLFETASVAPLNGRTPDQGSAWSTTGSTTDWVTGSGNAGDLQRGTQSDASPRVGTTPGAKTEVAVSIDAKASAGASELGLIARYVDASNYLFASLTPGDSGFSTVKVGRYVAGTLTVLRSLFVGPYIEGQNITRAKFANGIWHSLLLWARADGRVLFYIDGELMIALATESVLRSGGALASGTAGIYDRNATAVADDRRYDNFRAWVPDPDSITFAGKKVRWTHAGANRDDASGSTVSPLHIDGQNLLIPPKRRDGRKLRAVAFLTRGYPGLSSDDDNTPTDPTTLQLTTTPRYLSVRR